MYCVCTYHPRPVLPHPVDAVEHVHRSSLVTLVPVGSLLHVLVDASGQVVQADESAGTTDAGGAVDNYAATRVTILEVDHKSA